MKVLSVLVKVLFWLMISPFVLIGILIVGVLSTLLYQAYWDWRVEMMCARDGGRVVHEKIFLSKAEYTTLLDKYGDIHLPALDKVEPSDRYARLLIFESIHNGYLGLKVERYRFQVVYAKSKRIIAEQVNYARTAGDFPFTRSHYSSFGCPNFARGSWYKEIFTEIN